MEWTSCKGYYSRWMWPISYYTPWKSIKCVYLDIVFNMSLTFLKNWMTNDDETWNQGFVVNSNFHDLSVSNHHSQIIRMDANLSTRWIESCNHDSFALTWTYKRNYRSWSIRTRDCVKEFYAYKMFSCMMAKFWIHYFYSWWHYTLICYRLKFQVNVNN